MMLLFIRVISTAARVKCPEDDLLVQRMQSPIILAHWGSARTHTDTHTHYLSRSHILFFFPPQTAGRLLHSINYPPEKTEKKEPLDR